MAMTIETYLFLFSLVAVVLTGLYALSELFAFGAAQSRNSRLEAAVTTLFTLSAAWMALHVLVDPAVVTTYGDDSTKLSFDMLGMARNAGMCVFQVHVGTKALWRHKKQKEWGVYRYGFRHTDARGLEASRVARGHKLPR